MKTVTTRTAPRTARTTAPRGLARLGLVALMLVSFVGVAAFGQWRTGAVRAELLSRTQAAMTARHDATGTYAGEATFTIGERRAYVVRADQSRYCVSLPDFNAKLGFTQDGITGRC